MFPEWTPFFLVGVGIILIILLYVYLRNRLLVKIGLRNVSRRKATTFLVILGAILGTATISTAFIIGDTLENTIRVESLSSLGHRDEMLNLYPMSTSGDTNAASYLNESTVMPFTKNIAALPEVRSLLYGLSIDAPVQHIDAASGDLILATPSTQIIGIDPQQMCHFEISNQCYTLDDTEILLDHNIATTLDARRGDKLVINYQNTPYNFTVKAVFEPKTFWDVPPTLFGFNSESAKVFVNLNVAQHIIALSTEPPSSAGNYSMMNGPYTRVGGSPSSAPLAMPDHAVNFIYIANQGSGQTAIDNTDLVINQLNNIHASLGKTGESISFVTSQTKQDVYKNANEGAKMTTFVLLILGAFSTLAGIMLIINLFVMLAFERQAEMGILRAIGLKQGDLVKIYYAEGLTYSLLASFLGSLFGMVLARVAIGAYSYISSHTALTGGSSDLLFQARPISLINAFCIGFLITVMAIILTAGQISRFNIIRAIRDIQDRATTRRITWFNFLVCLVMMFGGLQAFLQGFAFAANHFISMLGLTFLVWGWALFLNYRLPARPVNSIACLILLLYANLGSLFLKNFYGNPFIFIIIAIDSILTATILLINNDRIVLWPLAHTLGRIKKLQSSIRMIVTYPLNARFRTGITLIMYSLVIFIVTTIGIVKYMSNVSLDTTINNQTGGYDYRILSNDSASPLPDLNTILAKSKFINPSDVRDTMTKQTFYLTLAPPGDSSKFPSYSMANGINTHYITSFGSKLPKIVNKQHPELSDAALWKKLTDDPLSIIVQDNLFERSTEYMGMPGAAPTNIPGPQLVGKKLKVCTSTESASCTERTVIATIKSDDDSTYVAGDPLIAALQLKLVDYQTEAWLAIQPKVNRTQFLLNLSKAVAAYGGNVTDVVQSTKDQVWIMDMFFTLLQGFLGIGLLIGITGLSIVMLRSVRERQQHIGVLRSIGFKRSDIMLIYFGETSFIAIVGTLIGLILGIVITYFLFRDQLSQADVGMTFAIPWLELTGIFAFSYIFSLLGAIIPSRQAAQISPAEVLRYNG